MWRNRSRGSVTPCTGSESGTRPCNAMPRQLKNWRNCVCKWSRHDRTIIAFKPISELRRYSGELAREACAHGASSKIHLMQEFISVNFSMSRNIRKNRRRRSHPQRIASGNRDVMLSRRSSGEPDMAIRLPTDPITKTSEQFRSLQTEKISRQPHAAMTSSRTKCKRITLGRSASSK